MADAHLNQSMSGGVNPATTTAPANSSNKEPLSNPANLKINIPDDVKAGSYSNAVSVNVNSNEVVVDFGYLLPNTQKPEIEVVARINLSMKTAESFMNVLKGAMEDFKKKQNATPSFNTQSDVGVAPPQSAMPHAMPAQSVSPSMHKSAQVESPRKPSYEKPNGMQAQAPSSGSIPPMPPMPPMHQNL